MRRGNKLSKKVYQVCVSIKGIIKSLFLPDQKVLLSKQLVKVEIDATNKPLFRARHSSKKYDFP